MLNDFIRGSGLKSTISVVGAMLPILNFDSPTFGRMFLSTNIFIREWFEKGSTERSKFLLPNLKKLLTSNVVVKTRRNACLIELDELHYIEGIKKL